MELSGKVAIITGATRGIGFAIAQEYLHNGATAIIFGSKEQTVNAALKLLKDQYPDGAVDGMWPSLTEPQAIDSALKSIIDKYSRIDILINNAGVTDTTSIYDYTPELFDKIMNINVRALFLTTLGVIPYMKAQGGGCIINTSSMVSRDGQAIGVAYPASKFAVNGITISLAQELGKDNIRVNAVAPGVVDTEMLRSLPSELIKQVISKIPLGRQAKPEEIAKAFVFLASDSASYISGEILHVDGADRG